MAFKKSKSVYVTPLSETFQWLPSALRIKSVLSWPPGPAVLSPATFIPLESTPSSTMCSSQSLLLVLDYATFFLSADFAPADSSAHMLLLYSFHSLLFGSLQNSDQHDLLRKAVLGQTHCDLSPSGCLSFSDLFTRLCALDHAAVTECSLRETEHHRPAHVPKIP